MSSETHKLATIVFTDIVGFTKLTAENEPLAIQLIKTQRTTLKPIVEKYNGEWLKEIGDGLLLAFQTSKSAVDCCIEIQNTIKHVANLNLRIGIHQGEVIQQGDDIMGDDVNVTSRVEPFASSGGIVVTEHVNASLMRDPVYQTKFVGEPELKGVRQSVRIYAITSHGLPEGIEIPQGAKLEKKNSKSNSKTDIKFSTLSKLITGVGLIAVLILGLILFIYELVETKKVQFSENSIAVLPFANFSSDKENEYFSDGITEEILNYLAKIKGLKVISRTSVFAYKDKEVNLKNVGQTLGVNHILEGSVRKSGNKVRITAQLIEVNSDAHLWSETYERDLTDIFAVQDEIAQTIVSTLKMNYIGTDESAPLIQEVNMDAYNAYLEGKHYQYLRSKTGFEKSIELFKKAIVLQDNYLLAYVGLTDSYVLQHEYVYADYSNIEKARETVNKALSLNSESSEALTSNARVLTFEKADQGLIEQNYKKAIFLNPNYSYARLWYAMYLFGFSVNDDQALEQIAIAEQLDPLSLIILTWHGVIIDDFYKAMPKFQKALEINPKFYRAYESLASYYLLEGKSDAYIQMMEEQLKTEPNSEVLLYRQAEFHYHLGQFDQAINYFERFNELNPNNLFVLNYIGVCNFGLGNLELAEKYGKRALEIYPNYGWGKILLSKIEFAKGNFSEAIKLVKSAEEYLKGVIYYRHTCDLILLQIYHQTQNIEKINEIITALKSKLSDREFYPYMGQVYFILDDYENAKFHLEQFLIEKPVHLWVDPTLPGLWGSEIGKMLKTQLKF